eukprot:m.177496 g.177496  ORF g.177496 m.177496 type:complete len:149 (-) comp53371_c0_seq40:1048-1494(-)
MTWLVFGVCAAIDFGLQIVFGVIAIVLRTERFYDLIGSLTFITLASVSLAWRGSDDDGGVSPRRIVQTSCVLLWAVRLGLFLVTRAALGEDRRFRKAKENPVLFMVYWLIQGCPAFGFFRCWPPPSFPHVRCSSQASGFSLHFCPPSC